MGHSMVRSQKRSHGGQRVKEAFHSAHTSSIMNGFQKCGLYLFDPNAVDFSKYISQFLTEGINCFQIQTMNKIYFILIKSHKMSIKLH